MARSTITVDVELRTLVDGSEIPFEWLLEAIKEKREREINPPLTEEQIRGMVGRWVWVEYAKHRDYDIFNGWKNIAEIHQTETIDAACSKYLIEIVFYGDDPSAYISNKDTADRIYAHEPKKD